MIKLPISDKSSTLSRNYNSQPTLENKKKSKELCITLNKLAIGMRDEQSAKSNDPKTDKSTKSSTKSSKTIKTVKSAP